MTPLIALHGLTMSAKNSLTPIDAAQGSAKGGSDFFYINQAGYFVRSSLHASLVLTSDDEDNDLINLIRYSFRQADEDTIIRNYASRSIFVKDEAPSDVLLGAQLRVSRNKYRLCLGQRWALEFVLGASRASPNTTSYSKVKRQ